jgi:protein-S-isoprenylcysteine O-methyltransferase Ste14
MQKSHAAVWSFIFLLIGPGTVLGVVPWVISGWKFQPVSFDIRVFGVVLIVLGLVPLVESVVRFALKGLGTLAPMAPPQHLVVTGFYRHVRNPMFVGFVAIIMGQAYLFGDPWLLAYAALVWLVTHLVAVLHEEPSLRRKFGAEYDTFRRHVPRWIPRLRPWKGA